MIVTIFRNRLRDDAQPEYGEVLARMAQLARAMPGFVATKTFVAEDGERCTIVEFADEASHRAWATHGEHVGAKARGREAFYSDYSLQVCEVKRDSRFKQS
jgi:heme-degrading monooxygenase HmoA